MSECTCAGHVIERELRVEIEQLTEERDEARDNLKSATISDGGMMQIASLRERLERLTSQRDEQRQRFDADAHVIVSTMAETIQERDKLRELVRQSLPLLEEFDYENELLGKMREAVGE